MTSAAADTGSPRAATGAGVLALPGARLAYQVTGEGPAVVLVHGFGLDMRMWDPQAEHLAQRFRVVRYDCRGFGASGPFDPAIGYTHAGDLLALLDHLGIGSAVLAGLSFGGRLVMQAALAAPGRVAGLILLDAVLDGVPWDPGSAGPLDETARQAQARGLLAGREAWLAHPLFAAARRQPEVAGSLAAMVAGYPGQHWIGHDPHEQTGPQPIDVLEHLAMPALVAVGEQDVPGFLEMSAVLARRIPGAQHRVVAGAGHMINMERPAEVNELLTQFLDQLYPHDGPALGDRVLVDPGWLEAHLHDPSVRVVEVDVGRAAHDEWHIDGATAWNVYADLKDADYQLITAPAVRRLFERSGITPDTTVVFYGYAPAMGLWLMKLYGHPDARILNCSRDTWQREGRPCSGAAAEPGTTEYPLDDPDGRIRADHTAVQGAIGDPGTTILDVRSWDEFRGERFWPSGGMEPGGRAGHVPTAVHRPIDDLHDDHGSFLAVDKLRELFPGIGPGGEVITYCTIGGRASTAWFVLTYLLGREHVRVYDGSWAEWGRMTHAPVEQSVTDVPAQRAGAV
jgi:3-mercaptopyruvate sulfurtransferase SseA/pimeloyl-ACP methyl ester carboxylesterase